VVTGFALGHYSDDGLAVVKPVMNLGSIQGDKVLNSWTNVCLSKTAPLHEDRDMLCALCIPAWSLFASATRNLVLLTVYG
jgi:hypothetical protein